MSHDAWAGDLDKNTDHDIKPRPTTISQPGYQSLPNGTEGSSKDRLGPGDNWADIAGDVFCVAVPLSLLGLLIAVVQLEGKSAGDAAFERWQNAISVVATLFPMMFAAVVGHMIYEMARRKLEKGSSLGSLEQLMGSRTFGGCVIALFTLPVFNVLTVALLSLWAFSPLGAQSLLRILDAPLEAVLSKDVIQHQDLRLAPTLLNAPIAAYSAGGFAAEMLRYQHLAMKFSAMFQVPHQVQSDTMDLWGNVKIPFLPDDLAEQDGRRDPAWRNIAWSGDLQRFSALSGIPITTVPVGNNTVHVESAYVEVDCFNISRIPSIESAPNLGWDRFWEDDRRPLEFRDNGTWQGIDLGGNENLTFSRGIGSRNTAVSWAMALDRFVNHYWMNYTDQMRRGDAAGVGNGDDVESARARIFTPERLVNETDIESGPTKLLFKALLDRDATHRSGALEAQCDVTQRYVESRVECRRESGQTRQNCTAVAYRPSQKPYPSEDISILSFPNIFLQMTARLPVATYTGSGMTDLAVQWLNLSQITGVVTGSIFQDIDPKLFSRRLSQILNTYIVLSSYYTGPDDGESDRVITPNATAVVDTTQLEAVYRVDRLWVAVAFVCCGVLLLGGVLSVVLAHRARGPKVLGYASSSIRDSKLVDMPREVGGVSGLDVSSEMRRVRLRLRYGYSDITLRERRLVGVGLEHETAPL